MPIRRSLSLCVLLCAALALPAFSDEPWQGTYVYDGAGNIKAIGANHYLYDGAGRLLEATAITPAQSLVRNFSYDAFGNLREMRDPSQVTQFGTDSSTNRMDAASRCVTGTCVVGQYDPEGHQIGGPVGYHYGYDSGDMMTSLDTGSRHEVYIYDANDQRIATVTGATTAPAWRYTLRDGGANVIREWTASGTSWSWTKDYVHRDGTLLASISDTEQRTHFHVDHLNTPRLLTDDEGRKVSIHTYWPFGLEANGSDKDAEVRKYAGHERDFAGPGNINDLDYMHARYYSPVAGRFLSVDPMLDVKKALRAPRRWNRYSYALNNPIYILDPDGRDVVYADQYSRDSVEAARKISPGTNAVLKEFENDRTRTLIYKEGDAPDIGGGIRLGQTMTRKDGNQEEKPTEFIVVLNKKDIDATGEDRQFVVIHETVGHVKPNSEKPRGQQGNTAQREREAQRRTAEEIRKIPVRDRPKVPANQEQP